MKTQTAIERKLQELQPQLLRVENESHMHNVPPGSESHFKVTLVTPRFDGKPLLARHRLVNAALAAELGGGVHALALHTFSPDEWAARTAGGAGGDGGASPVADSPQCLGGKAGEQARGEAD